MSHEGVDFRGISDVFTSARKIKIPALSLQTTERQGRGNSSILFGEKLAHASLPNLVRP
jgi:hypothetical protein